MATPFASALLALAFAAPQSEESPPAAPPATDVTPLFRVAEGLAVTLWAESPNVFNPTAIDVDARGRVWVTEAVNYRKWGGRNPGLAHEGGDRVVILEDTDGDGVADSSKVFVQEKDLVSPIGIAVIGDRVFVSCSPSLVVYTDSDGDDRPDEREVFLTGFGGHDHDHGLHSVVAGPDGRLYFNAGNAGPHVVTDKSGWTLRSGSLYGDGGAESAPNAAGLRSDDGRAWTGGLVLRVEPDGRGLAVLAHNFRNNYEVALDSYGNLFQSDNDDDGNESCRTLFVMEGGNHGYFSADGSRYWTADRRPGQSTPDAHWHQDDPGVIPAGKIHGAGGPTGVAVYEGDLLPALRGSVLDADAGRNRVWTHRPVARGAGYDFDEGTLIAPAADDEAARLFRPSDVAVGVDGAVFVADWYDPGVGGHAMADTAGYGRILRIAPPPAARAAGSAAPPKKTVPPDVKTVAGAVAALRSPAVNVREAGFRALVAAGGQALPAVRGLLGDADQRVRARALPVAARIAAARPLAESALRDPDVMIRVAAFRALRGTGGDLVALARAVAADPSPALRREAAIALRDVPVALSRDLLHALALGVDPADRFAIEAFGIAADGKEESLYPELRALFGGDGARESAAFRALAWRLHPVAAIADLRSWALAADLPDDARLRAVDALAFIRDRAAAEAMLDLALAGTGPVRDAAAWWVQNRDTNDWSEYGLAKNLGPASLEGARLLWESGLVSDGVHDVHADVAGATHLLLEVTDGGNGNACDWADWIEPRLVGPEGEVALTTLTWLRASAEWGSVRVGRNAAGAPLVVGGKGYADGIGTHAKSEILYRLPEGRFTEFRAQVGLDDGGAGQAEAPSSVVFRVHVVVPPDRSAFIAARQTLLDPGAAPEARLRAAAELAAEADGAALLVRLAEKGELPPGVRAGVAGALLAHEDPSIRALAAPHFAAPPADGLARLTVDEVMRVPGDARRGETVFFCKAAECSACHRYRGRGGDVGPELTAIRSKYGKTELLDHILNPSRAIAFGYDAWVIETDEGLVHTGFVLAEGENVLLKDTSGARRLVPAARIVSRAKQATSTMPDSIALTLMPEDLADVAAFLLADPDEPPKFGEEKALFNGKDMTGWTFHLADKNAKMEDVWSVADGIIRCKGNPVGYIRTTEKYANFVLTLEWRFPPGKPPGNSGVLMRQVGEDKVWPKSIEAQLMHKNAGDIWNIDEFPMQADAARTNGRHTAKMHPTNEKPLGEWNRYVITLNGGDLTLEVNGLVQNKAAWCEEVAGPICLQSEGAEIEFRDIRLKPILK